MDSNVIDTLARCALLSALDEASRDRLAGIAVRKTLSRGQIVFRPGEAPPGVYIVGSGLVRLYLLSPAGKELILHFAGPGQTFAEVAALGDFPVPAYAEAVEESRCVLLPTAALRAILDADHRLAMQLVAGLSQWVKHLVGLLEGIVLRDAAGRVAAYLLRADVAGAGVVELPSLKKHVAQHLNLTSETLSRTLRQFRDEGLIAERDESRIELLDRGRLADAAEGLFPRL